MNTGTMIIIGLILMWMIVATVIVGIFGIKYLDIKRTTNKLNYNKILADTFINKNDLDILDDIISTAFDEYRVFNLEFEEDLYLNSDKIQLILMEVLAIVLNRVSPNLIDKLSLIYNRDYIEDIIYKKIETLVLNYSIEINGNYNG